MKDDLLKQAVRKSCHRITKDEVIAGNRKRFSQLGLDDHDIQVMADAVGLELEDLLLLSNSVSVISRPAPAKPGTPGRKDETFDIAVFAKERRDREPQMTWDEIYRDWIRTYPNGKPAKDKECIREAHRRYFGDKSRAAKSALKKP